MSNKRYAVIILKFGLLASVLAAAFWGIWSMFATVPDHSVLRLTPVTSWTIPLSRWFDVVSAFFAVQLYAWLIRGYLLFGKKVRVPEDDLFIGLFVGLFVGLIVGLFVGLVYGLVVGLFAGFGLGLFVGLIVCLGASFGAGLGAGLGFGLGICLFAGLGVCLGAGLGVGFVVCFVFGLGAGLVYGLVYGLRYLFSLKIWSLVSRWFLTKDVN